MAVRSRLVPALLVVLVLLPAAGARASGPVSERWVARYDGPGHAGDHGSAVVADAAGNIYVTGPSWGATGSREDMVTTTYASSGAERSRGCVFPFVLWGHDPLPELD
jgi:hypothetical protein